MMLRGVALSYARHHGLQVYGGRLHLVLSRIVPEPTLA